MQIPDSAVPSKSVGVAMESQALMSGFDGEVGLRLDELVFPRAACKSSYPFASTVVGMGCVCMHMSSAGGRHDVDDRPLEDVVQPFVHRFGDD